MNRTYSALLGAAMIVAAIQPLAAQRATPVVATDKGQVRGLEQDGVDAFLGIHYAAPPIGERRFQPRIGRASPMRRDMAPHACSSTRPVARARPN